MALLIRLKQALTININTPHIRETTNRRNQVTKATKPLLFLAGLKSPVTEIQEHAIENIHICSIHMYLQCIYSACVSICKYTSYIHYMKYCIHNQDDQASHFESQHTVH